MIIPIADRHRDPPTSWRPCCRARGLRVEVDSSENRMQNKIRLAQEQKIPFMLVLGDREVEGRTAALRHRAGSRSRGSGGTSWRSASPRRRPPASSEAEHVVFSAGEPRPQARVLKHAVDGRIGRT